MRETVIYKYDLQLNVPEKVVKPESIFLNGVPLPPNLFCLNEFLIPFSTELSPHHIRTVLQ